MSPATTGQQGSHSPKQEVCFLLALCLLRMYEIWGPWASCPWVLCKLLVIAQIWVVCQQMGALSLSN